MCRLELKVWGHTYVHSLDLGPFLTQENTLGGPKTVMKYLHIVYKDYRGGKSDTLIGMACSTLRLKTTQVKTENNGAERGVIFERP